MITLDKAHEEINGEITQTIPQDGDIKIWPDDDDVNGYRFVYKEDHWEHEPE
jgi:hypothetical protein